MTAAGFALFDTAIGRCGIAWGDRGIVGVQLPEGGAAQTRARLARLFPDAAESAPPPEVAAATAKIALLLDGRQADLTDIPLDLAGLPPFRRRVYEAARQVPPGETVSYGQLATRLGAPRSARAVGQALGRNPFAIVVPCHRVVASGGRTGGFSAAGGVGTKLRMLAIERDAASERLDPGRPRYPFDPEAAVEHLRAADPELGPWIDRIGPFDLRLKTAPTVFAVLAEAIVHQQLSGKAAATIFGRLCTLAAGPDGHPDPRRIARVADGQLRGAGLSRAKLLAIRDLARRAGDGDLPTLEEVAGMDDELAVRELTKVRGIGRWSAEMFLIFRLARPDVLPVDDLGLRSAVALTHRLPGNPDPAWLREHGAAWQPYRTVACWYLWEVLELARAEPDLR